MDPLSAAKMKATTTVTLLIIFLTAVGCSAAEANAGEKPIDDFDDFDVDVDDFDDMILDDVLEDIHCHGDVMHFTHAGVSVHLKGDVRRSEVMSMDSGGVRFHVQGIKGIRIQREGSKEGIRIQGIRRMKGSIQDNEVHIHVQEVHGDNNEEDEDLNDVDYYVDDDGHGHGHGRVVDGLVVDVDDDDVVVDKDAKLDHDGVKVNMHGKFRIEELRFRESTGTSTSGEFSSGGDGKGIRFGGMKDLAYATPDLAYATHLAYATPDHLACGAARVPGGSWIVGGIFSLTVLLAAALALISWNLKKKTEASYNKASISKQMK